MRKLTGILAFVCILLIPFQLMAAPFDGSSPLMCAVIESFECSLESDCMEVTVEDMNIPQFIKIDFASKRISGPEESENKRETAIKNMEHNNGMLVLQGAEAGRGWNMIISEDTGKMSGAISEDRAGFVIFGACTLD